jgi:hypothetical protein
MFGHFIPETGKTARGQHLAGSLGMNRQEDALLPFPDNKLPTNTGAYRVPHY